MTTIDQRVVQMKFNNAEFENKVKTSIGTLDKLKQSLNFSGLSNNFKELSNSVNNLNFNSFTNNITENQRTFSVWTEFCSGAVRKVASDITDVLGNSIKGVIKDFSALAQAGSGFSKYESIIESTQTIQATSEASAEEIESALGRLQWFADETSYSLSDMTTAMSKLVSSGVELDDAVVAAQGIANWAAESGVSASRASSAYYNLAQAIGTGAMKLQDWKSLENLTMATPQFKQAAINAAVAAGTIKDLGDGMYAVVGAESKMFNATTHFDEYLSEGWFTSGVLMDTLEDYGDYSNLLKKFMEEAEDAGDGYDQASDAMEDFNKYLEENNIKLIDQAESAFLAAQSYKTWKDVVDATKDAMSTAWSRIFTDIFGNLDEAKKLWTKVGGVVYDIFASGIVKLADMADKWKDLGGRTKLLDSIENLYTVISNIFGIFKYYLSPIFKSVNEFNSGTLLSITNNLYRVTTYIASSSDLMVKISKLFSPIGQFVILIKEAISQISDSIKESTDKSFSLMDIFGKILGFASEIAVKLTKWINPFYKAFKEVKPFYNILNSIFRLFKELGRTVSILFSYIKPFINGLKRGLGIEDALQTSSERFEFFYNILTKVTDTLVRSINWLTSKLKIFNDNLEGNEDTAESVGYKVGKIILSIYDKIKMVVNYIKDNIPKTSEEWAELPNKLLDKIKEFVRKTPEYAKAISELPSVLRDKIHDMLEDYPEAQEKFDSFCNHLSAGWTKLQTGFESLDNINAKLKEFIEYIKTDVKTTVLSKIDTTVQSIRGGIEDVITYAKSIFSSGSGTDASESIDNIAASVDKAAESIEKVNIFEKIDTAFKNFSKAYQNGEYDGLISLLKQLFAGKILYDIISFFTGIAGCINGVSNVLKGVKNLLDDVGDGVESFLTNTGKGIKSMLKGVGSALSGVGNKLTADAALELALAISILVGVCWLITKIPEEEMTKAVQTIITLFLGIAIVFKSVAKAGQNLSYITSFAIGIGILVASLYVLTTLDVESMAQAGLYLVLILMALANTTKSLGKVSDGSKIENIAVNILAMTAGVMILTIALLQLAKFVNSDVINGSSSLTTAVISLMVMMLTITNMAKSMEKIDASKLSKSSLSLMILIADLELISLALTGLAFANKFTGSLIESTLALVVVMLALSNFSKALSKLDATNMMKAGLALIPIVASLTVVIAAIGALAIITKMVDTTSMLAATAVVIILLIALTALVKVFSKYGGNNNILSGNSVTVFNSLGLTLIGFAVALVAIAGALRIISEIKLMDLIKSAIALVGMIAVMIFSINRLKDVSGPKIKAILTLAVALLAISSALALLAKIDTGGNVLQAALSLAIVIGVMVAGIAVLSLIAGPQIEIIAAAFLTFSASILVFSASLLVLELAASGFIAIAELIASSGSILDKGLDTIIDIMPKFRMAFVEFFKQIIWAVVDVFPILVESILVGIWEILKSIVNNLPSILEMIIEIVFMVIYALIEVTGDLVYALGMWLLEIIDGFNRWVNENDVRIANSLVDLLESLYKIIVYTIFELINRVSEYVKNEFPKVFASIGDFFKGVGISIKEAAKNAWAQAVVFATSILDGLNEKWDALTNWIRDAIIQMTIKAAAETWRLMRIGQQMVDSLLSGLTGGLLGSDAANESEKAGEAVTTGLANGMSKSKLVKMTAETAEARGKEVLDALRKSLDVHSPSKETFKIGEYFTEGFANGIEDKIPETLSKIKELGSGSLSSLKDGLSLDMGTNDIFNSDSLKDNISKYTESLDMDSLLGDDVLTITPVLDLSEIQSGSKDLDNILSEYSGSSSNIPITAVTSSYSTNSSYQNKNLNSISSYDQNSQSYKQQEQLSGLAESLRTLGSNEDSTTIENTFNISSNNGDPNEIAQAVSNIIQKQYEQNKMKWR